MRPKWLLVTLGAIAVILSGYLLWPGLHGKNPIKLGLDISGGVLVRYKPDFSQKLESYKNLPDKELLRLCKEVLQSRLYTKLKTTPDIVIRGDNSILVSIPSLQNPAQVLDIVGQTYHLTMRLVLKGSDKPSDNANLYAYHGHYLLLGKPLFSGDMLDLTSIRIILVKNKPEVKFKFKPPHDKRFEEFTKRHLGGKLAILIDDRVMMAPVIRAVITSGEGVISGDYTDEQARDTAMLLRSGSLPISLEMESIQSVGPTLGHEVKESGARAMVLSLILLLAIIALVYLHRIWFLLAALIAIFCLLFTIAGFASSFGLTLDIAAIAGLVLTVGMGMDAFIIIFESLEQRLIRFTPADIARHYRFIIRSIYSFKSEGRVLLHSNLTTVIALLPLIYVERVKYFALFIVVGVMASLYTILVTRETLYATYGLASKTGSSVFGCLRGRRTNIFRFHNYYLFFACTAAVLALIIVGLSFLGNDYLRFGSEFRPGTQIVVQVKNDSDISAIMVALESKFSEISVSTQEIETFAESSKPKLYKRFLLSLPLSLSDVLKIKQESSKIRPQGHRLSGEKINTQAGDTPKLMEQLQFVTSQGSLTTPNDAQALTTKTLLSILSDLDVQLLSVDSVDSKLSSRRFMSSISVIFASFFLIVLYLFVFQNPIDAFLFRFDASDEKGQSKRQAPNFWTSFGIIIAVMHDVAIIILGCWLLEIDISIPVIAGVLTIVGYSVNDSVVLLSHIQNRISGSAAPNTRKEAENIVSKSVDAILSRATLTSITTIIPAIVIFLTGIKELTGFAYVMIIGVIAGTVSSIFIVGTFTVQSLTTKVQRPRVISEQEEEPSRMSVEELKKKMLEPL